MRKKLRTVAAFMLPLFFCCGCFDQQIFENTAIIIYAGAEKSDTPGKLLFSIAAAENEEKDGSLRILTREDVLLESAVATLNMESPDPLRSGKLQNILFSEDLARDGISAVSDANHLDASNRFLADYVVVEGSPKEMLEVTETLEKRNGSYGYLETMLENAANAGLCPNTLHQEFDIYFETEGIDPVLPLVSYDTEKETVTVEGTALFHEDRYVGNLTVEESRYLSMMQSSADIISVKMQNLQNSGRDLTLNIIEGFDRSYIDIINDRLFITVKLNTHSYFTVNNWAEISQASRREIEEEIESTLEQRCTEVYQKLQAHNCDPLGITAKVRAYYNDFYQTHDMTDVYQNAIVNFQIHNTLTNQKN